MYMTFCLTPVGVLCDSGSLVGGAGRSEVVVMYCEFCFSIEARGIFAVDYDLWCDLCGTLGLSSTPGWRTQLLPLGTIMDGCLKELDFGNPWSCFKFRVSAVAVNYNVAL